MLLLTNFPPHSRAARNIVSQLAWLPLLSRLVKLLNFSKNMLSQELPFSLDHFHQRRRGIINSNRILTVCLCVHLKEAISHSDVWETLSLQPVKTENMVKRVVNSLDIVRLQLLLCYDSVDTKYLLCNAGDMKGKVNECSQLCTSILLYHSGCNMEHFISL